MVTQLAQKILSIHAPTRGATIERLVYHLYHITFNPRSYKRSDGGQRSANFKLELSIHAPTRGATL